MPTKHAQNRRVSHQKFLGVKYRKHAKAFVRIFQYIFLCPPSQCVDAPDSAERLNVKTSPPLGSFFTPMEP